LVTPEKFFEVGKAYNKRMHGKISIVFNSRFGSQVRIPKRVHILMQLSTEQNAILALSKAQTLFLHGPAGSGKTTVAGQCMLQLLREAPDDPS
jgi:Cdc6-like AAA superfamily ATPase